MRVLASRAGDDKETVYVLHRQRFVSKGYLCHQGRGAAFGGLFEAGEEGAAISVQMSAWEWVAFDEEKISREGLGCERSRGMKIRFTSYPLLWG